LPTLNKSAPTGRIVVKFDIRVFFEIRKKIQVLLNIDKNNGYFTWRSTCIFHNISLHSS